MKNIIRIAIIILVAVLVATITWFAGYNAGTNQTARFGDEGPRGEFAFEGGEGFPDAGRPDFPERGRGRDEFHERGGSSLFGFLSFARTLIPITFVIAGVVLAQNLIGRWQQRRSPKTPTTPPEGSPPPAEA
ncbi:MAG: hypothetical protein KA314_27975 [Chloroflexi bacterium]|nr:hypothetical protein [Chloroflexota bacterium]MBP8059695.1 hypothetical protein [Chloroflexota bacterium]